MEDNYDDMVLLERYIERSLSPEENLLVERRLMAEPTFKELFQNEKLLVSGIRYSHLKTKQRALKELEATLPSINRGNGKEIGLIADWRVWAAAASILLAIGTFFLLNRPVAPEQLYAQYFQPYPNIIEPLNRGANEQTERTQALAAYEQHDYAKAAEGFNRILAIGKNPEPEILLLLGNANLILNKTAEARNNFITLSKDFDTYDAQAKWFLSLCYLKTGNKDEARVALEELAAGGSSYRAKASELLKKMN